MVTASSYLAWILVPVLAAAFWLAYRQRVAGMTRRLEDMTRMHMSTIEALALAIDAKDPYAQGRARRVQAYALALARCLRVAKRDYEAVKAAALLHDIGNLAIPDHLLHKPGRLSAIEYQKIKAHPAVAAGILASVAFPHPVVPAIRHHHERWDGTGYPDGLKGEEIPLGARILAVADALEAMTSDRVYRPRQSSEEACAVIESWSGTQFDPRIVQTLRDNLPAIVQAAVAAAAAPDAVARVRGAYAAEDDGGIGLFHGAALLGGDESPGLGDFGGFGDTLHHGVASGAGSGARRGDGGEPDPTANAGAAGDAREDEPPGLGTAAGATGRATFLSDISSAHREVYALYEIAQTLGSSLRLADVLEMVVEKIGRLVPYHTCVVHLLEDGSDTLSARFVAGAHADDLRGRSLRLGEGITGSAASQRTNKLSADPGLDLKGAPVDPGEYSAVAAFPLCHDNDLLGVITLYFPKGVPCLDDHIRLMDIVARLAAGAVLNGTIFAETQESALTDDLTGLPNSRYLRQIFEQERIRCQQAGQPLAFLEMDLDNFKEVNDRHGHITGDRYLAETARLLKSHLRERDILVRLSGDEFAAILPMTGFAAAALLVERLQRAMDVFSLRLDGGKVARSGLSAGIALHPQDGETFEELLVRADYNMYQDKAARKNARRSHGPKILPFPLRQPSGAGS